MCNDYVFYCTLYCLILSVYSVNVYVFIPVGMYGVNVYVFIPIVLFHN